MSQIEENIKAIEIKLTDEQMKRIEDSAPFDLGFPMNMIQMEPQLTGQTQNGFLSAGELFYLVYALDRMLTITLAQHPARSTGSALRKAPIMYRKNRPFVPLKSMACLRMPPRRFLFSVGKRGARENKRTFRNEFALLLLFHVGQARQQQQQQQQWATRATDLAAQFRLCSA